MNKIKQTIVVIALLAIGAGGLFLYNNNNDTKNQDNSTNSQVAQTVDTKKPEITSSEDKRTVSYDGQTGKTALEILKDGAEVTTESSSFGDFVSGINGLVADSSKNYWSFYVNGAYASEGAGTYKTTDGEKIQWRLEDL